MKESESRLVEIGDHVKIVSDDEYRGYHGTVSHVETDQEGAGLVTVIFEDQPYGGVEDFAVEEIELLGTNMFQEHNGH